MHFLPIIFFLIIYFPRFLLIGYPLKAKQILTKWNIRISILLIWVVAIITTLPLPIRFTFVAVAHFKEVRICIMHNLDKVYKDVAVSIDNLLRLISSKNLSWFHDMSCLNSCKLFQIIN